MNLLTFLAFVVCAAAFLGAVVVVVGAWDSQRDADREERTHAKDTKSLGDAEELRQRIQRIELAMNMKPLARKQG